MFHGENEDLFYLIRFLQAIENFPSRRDKNSDLVLVSEKMELRASNHKFNQFNSYRKFI